VGTKTIKQWWTARTTRETSKPAAGSRAQDAHLPAVEAPAAPALSTEERASRRAERVRGWRRRALMRKGARLYSTMSATADFGSLAMLDEDGFVVAWFERSGNREFGGGLILHRHVSQLYTPEDIAFGVPVRALHSATLNGSSTQMGWRRSPDGATFWASTVIEPMKLRDGRTQGFSHVTRRCAAPWENEIKLEPWPQHLFDAFKALKPLPTRRRSSGVALRGRHPQARARIGYLRGTAAMLVFSAAAAVATPTSPTPAVPAHATANSHGSGWQCQNSYRRVDDACVKVTPPKNAYLDATGSRWRCNRGYLSVGDACVAIKLPANAYLDASYGTGWRCDRDHREARGACVAVRIPAHAHPTDSDFGSGWECDRGYLLTSDRCEALTIPAQGYLTRLGDDWRCKRGFTKTADDCVAIEIPVNAYLETDGSGWTCERGFAEANAQCRAIRLPPSAHLDHSGNDWECDRGFRRGDDRCVAD
jgi:hypothetical protein